MKIVTISMVKNIFIYICILFNFDIREVVVGISIKSGGWSNQFNYSNFELANWTLILNKKGKKFLLTYDIAH